MEDLGVEGRRVLKCTVRYVLCYGIGCLNTNKTLIFNFVYTNISSKLNVSSKVMCF
jgi:hypothetical protein